MKKEKKTSRRSIPRPAPRWLPEAPPPWQAWDPRKGRRAPGEGNIDFPESSPPESNIDFPELIAADGDGNIDFPESVAIDGGGNIDFPEARESGGNIDFPEFRFGCVPDVPDHRDHDLERHLRPHFEGLGATDWRKRALSPLFESSAELESSIRLQDDKSCFRLASDQGAQNSCTAHAVCGLMEYMLQKARRPIVLSRLFLFRQARVLDNRPGNVGCSIRSALRVARRFGVPPEALWPNRPGFLDTRPATEAFKEAHQYRISGYYRLDGKDSSGSETLRRVKRSLAAGFPVVIGTTIFDTIEHLDENYVVPFPSWRNVRTLGSHALLVLGYQDWPPLESNHKGAKKMGRVRKGPEKQSGEHGYFIVRNSWGSKFADYGFAYLDYRYVLEQLVVDCWTVSGVHLRKPS